MTTGDKAEDRSRRRAAKKELEATLGKTWNVLREDEIRMLESVIESLGTDLNEDE